MLFISVSVFVFFIVCILAGVAGMGIRAYLLFMEYGEKATAEVFFYIAVCTTLLIFAFIISIVLYSRRKQNMIKRMVKMARVNGVLAVQRFSELGKLGEHLTVLFQEVLSLSEKRANRIVYLDNAVESLLPFVDKPIFLVDRTGSIQYVSDNMLKVMGLEGKILSGTHVEEVFPELSFPEVAKEVERRFSEYEVKLEKVTLSFSPVFGKESSVSGLFVIVKKNTILTAGGSAMKNLYDSLTQKKDTSEENKHDKPEKRRHPERDRHPERSEGTAVGSSFIKNLFGGFKKREKTTQDDVDEQDKPKTSNAPDDDFEIKDTPKSDGQKNVEDEFAIPDEVDMKLNSQDIKNDPDTIANEPNNKQDSHQTLDVSNDTIEIKPENKIEKAPKKFDKLEKFDDTEKRDKLEKFDD